MTDRSPWTKTVAREEAYWEMGLFAIQHNACKLRNQFTIERLTQHFGLEDCPFESRISLFCYPVALRSI